MTNPSRLTPGPDHAALQHDQLVIVPATETVVVEPNALTGQAGVVAVTPANEGVPTQVANPTRTVVRTIVQGIVGLLFALPTINLVLAAIQDELTKSGLEIPAWLWVALNGAVAAVTVVSAIVARIMAIPKVNEWIKRSLSWLAAIPVSSR